MSLAARYGNSASLMHRSRLIRHRSVRRHVPEGRAARTRAAPSAASDTRDAATGRASAEVCIHTAKLGREPADGIAGGDGRAARGAHPREALAIAGQCPNRDRNGLRSPRLNQQTVDPVRDELRYPSDPGRDYRKPRGHALKQRVGQSFGVAGEDEDIRPLQQSHLGRPAHGSEERNALEPLRYGGLPQPGFFRACAGDDQFGSDALAPRERQALQELVQTLLPNEPTYI